ncbi:MAG: L-threonylcarbamoyladenylate synthase [Bdellovibrionia bacterium]
MIVPLKVAVEKLKSGEVVAIPTETVYGLAAPINNLDAIKKIFSTKERPFFDPLIVHVSDITQAKSLVKNWLPQCQVLAEAFWPGPLTLVISKSTAVSDLITSGLEGVGLRMPNHPIALQIINEVGVPLAAPSANKFGKTSPTMAIHVENEFKNEAVAVVDGGPCQVGIESTVLLVQQENGEVKFAVLRKGAITAEQISAALAQQGLPALFFETTDKKVSPGHMKHHYMPAVPFVISKSEDKVLDLHRIGQEVFSELSRMPDEIEGIKIVKPEQSFNAPQELKLSLDPALAARSFYAQLREIAQGDTDLIVFNYHESLHSQPAWEALMERMFKAASLVLEN